MKSMTGYASASKEVTLSDGKDHYHLKIMCEVKTLNSRFTEIITSLPPVLFPYETEIRKVVAEGVKRGKVYTWLKIESGKAPITVVMDESVLEGVERAMGRHGITDEGTILSTIPFDTLFTIFPKNIEETSLSPVYDLIRETITGLNEMRTREGESTKDDLSRLITSITEGLAVIKEHAEEASEKQYTLLKENLTRIVADIGVEEQRVMSEAAVIANKVNINEEIKRLDSHIEQFTDLLVKKESVAKKLEFLAQELLRETNTIASKSQDIAIVRATLTMKEHIEEIKEQARNIE